MSNTRNELQDRILGHILPSRNKVVSAPETSTRGTRLAFIMIGVAFLVVILSGCSAKTEVLATAPAQANPVVTTPAAPAAAETAPSAAPVETPAEATPTASLKPAVQTAAPKPAATAPAASAATSTKPAPVKVPATKSAAKPAPVVGVETPFYEPTAKTIVAAYTKSAPTRWEHNYGLVAQGNDVLFVSFQDGTWIARWYRGLDHYTIEQTSLGKTFVASCNADASTGYGYAQRVGSSYSADTHPGSQIWLPAQEFLNCND